jgi:hypothetical protein
MGAALRLITTDRRQTVQRALLIMALATGPYFITPRIPEPYQWFFMPLVVFIMFGIPVGVMLLIEETVSRHKWVAPTIAGFCFRSMGGLDGSRLLLPFKALKSGRPQNKRMELTAPLGGRAGNKSWTRPPRARHSASAGAAAHPRCYADPEELLTAAYRYHEG